ncbi:tyrosine-type recombinase/integrase, partial [Acinetobacter baumannii]
DRTTWAGRRDHVLLLLAVQTGLRASELVGLTLGDVVLGSGAHVRCMGKGRKERATPLHRETA